MTSDLGAILEAIDDAQTNNILQLLAIAGRTGKSALRGGDWGGCDFSENDLRGYDFSNCYLVGARFCNARVSGCIWTGAIGRDITDAIVDESETYVPTFADFELRMRLAESFAEAQQVYDDLKRVPLPATGPLLNVMMSKCSNYRHALYVHGLYATDWLKPDKFAFSMIFGHVDNEELANDWGQKMLFSGTPLDVKCFNSWLSKVKSKSAIEAVVGVMQDRHIAYDRFTYNILIGKAENFVSAKRTLGLMEEAGFKPDAVSLRTLLNKIDSFSDGRGVLDTMQDLDIEVDNAAFNTWMKFAKTDDEIATVLATMKGHDREPDLITYNTLVKNSPDFERGVAHLKKLCESGFVPDDFTFNHLIQKVTTVEEARALLDVRQSLRLPFTSYTISGLEGCCRKLQIRVDSKVAARPSPSKSTAPAELEVLGSLLLTKIAEDMQQAVSWYLSMVNVRRIYDDACFIALTSHAKSQSDANFLVNALEKAEVRQSPKFLDALYRMLAKAVGAEALLKFHWKRKNWSSEPLNRAVGTYLNEGKLQDALRIALHFPNLENCRKAIALDCEKSVVFFDKYIDRLPHDAHYALGYAFLLSGNDKLAAESFSRARKATKLSNRIADIDRRLRDLASD